MTLYSVLAWLIRIVFNLYIFALIGRALLPLLGVSYAHPVMRFLWDITEPLLAPIRRRLPRMGPVDWSPTVLILILWFVMGILTQVLRWLL